MLQPADETRKRGRAPRAAGPSPAEHIHLLECLTARLCHELVGPVGAVNNGVELMTEEGQSGEALELVADSGRQAAARLRCYRLAYGGSAMGGDDPMQLRAVAADLLAGTKILLDWPQAQAAAALPAGVGKQLLNLLLMTPDILIHGGRASVGLTVTADGRTARVTLTLEGRTAVLGEPAEAALKGAVDVAAITPRLIHPYLTGSFARAYRLPLAWHQDPPGRLTIGFEGPEP